MIKIEKCEVYGWEAALRGMRNPFNSWKKSDTVYGGEKGVPIIGDADGDLMLKLANSGESHGKFLRMITVTMDITAPLYWWKEFDTYKVGTVSNSCSTMHSLHNRDLTLDDFSIEHLLPKMREYMDCTIFTINAWRRIYNNTGDKSAWWQMIQLLPSSYNQKRTVQLNYAVLRRMYHERKSHRQDEWREFCKFIEKLPYASPLMVLTVKE